MIFNSGKKAVNKNASRMDKIVTGVIITGAAASIFGISRTKKGKKVSHNIGNGIGVGTKVGLHIFGKATVKTISFFKGKK